MDDSVIINRIDRIDHLHSLVRQDVKELGIKLPKLKRLRKLNQTRSQDGFYSNRIFGEPLCQIPGIVVPDYGYVPQFLIDATRIVDKNVEVEGIFRKSGSVSRQKELQMEIDEGKSFEAANVFDVACLIKQFFRELPEPLFASVFHESLIRCYNLAPDKDPKRALLQMCLLLPLENIGALRFTLHMLHRVAAMSDKNKMTSNNLALVMAPNMMHSSKNLEKMYAGEEKLRHTQTCIVELLIKDWEQVGMVGPVLRQQLNMLSECFGTDDDLDASDDNTLEDSKDVQLRKKRKRSGSLTGLVNSIAQGFAKLRRSGDGKSLSLSSNSTTREENSLASVDIADQTQDIFSQSVTPCVMRKRPACPDSMPFSASKKQAILGALHQRSALASTPFTPATAFKKSQQHGSGVRTVSLNITTPAALGSKTSRKKLNLFGGSPNNNKKVKRQTSECARMESSPAPEKSGKGMNFFRRLSGNRSGKRGSRDMSVASFTGEENPQSTDPSGLHVESSHSELTAKRQSSHDPELTLVVVDDQPVVGFSNDAGALKHALKNQTCLPEVGHHVDDMGYSIAAGRFTRSECVDSLERENLWVLEGHGDQNPVTGASVGNLEPKVSSAVRQSRRDEFEQERFTINSSSHNLNRNSSEEIEMSLMDAIVLPPPPGFGDHTIPVEEELVYPGKNADEDEEIDVGSEIVSMSGFSTISGGTVMRRTESGSYSRQGTRSRSGVSIVSSGSCDSVLGPPTKFKPLGASVSNDSLFSVESRMSDESGAAVCRLSRCASSDSGKGSMLDDAVENVCSNFNEKHERTFVSFGNSVTDTANENCHATKPRDRKGIVGESCRGISTGSRMELSRNVSALSPLSESNSFYDNVNGQSIHATSGTEFEDIAWQAHSNRRRSISAQNLGAVSTFRSSMCARSHSIHFSTGRRFNYKPHLEITRKTHNLLHRAGFFKSTDDNSNSDSVQVEVKSPKRSSHREEMIQTLRTSFRERHGPMNSSIRSSGSRFSVPGAGNVIQENCNSNNSGQLTLPHLTQIHKGLENISDVQTRSGALHAFDEVQEVVESLTGTEKPVSKPPSSVASSDMLGKACIDYASWKGSETDMCVETLVTDSESHMEPHSKQVTDAADSCKVSKGRNNTDKQQASRMLDKEIVHEVKILRAEVKLPRHDSIANIQQAGLVSQSVKHFSLSQTDGPSCSFAMPPVSKRGTSPIRIPTIFARKEEQSSHYRQVLELMREKSDSKGSAKASANHDDADKAQQGIRSDVNDEDLIEDMEIDLNDVTQTHAGHSLNFNNCHPFNYIKGAGIDLSESLEETITDVCTPRSVKHTQKKYEYKCQTKSPLMESTNTLPASCRLKLRTSGGKTPHQISVKKEAVSQARRNTPARNNLHHVKRLHTQNSPWRRNIRSPKSVTNSPISFEPANPADALRVPTHVNLEVDQENAL